MDQYFERISFPFTISELFHGFAQAHGIFRVEEDAVVLEYVVQDGFLGAIKSSVRTLRISYGQIESLTMRKGWWRRSIVLRTATMDAPTSIPGNATGEIRLSIKREDKPKAQEAISRLSLRMSEERLKKIENW